MEWTLGVYNKGNGERYWELSDSSANLIAYVEYGNDSEEVAENLRNFTLLSAAPDLLSALQSALEGLYEIETPDEATRARIRKAEKALDKEYGYNER